ncbi:mannose-6-phosphate isomerase, class I [Streptomyces sp. SP17BM10]|uniref:mannose-6-phosphate isomerase, class I n=1 Tax=Streptomyces sp. SP17BM10 TaxID=3002530 RepID=UPI002E78F9B2|nr:mannose-6-phosphate isomerase, class I [Streptomyces sp. SP17BM10]MEE1786282.1 mannose-6-phosphate isomerase, class I [Streptomyces sp. SP17BM10]
MPPLAPPPPRFALLHNPVRTYAWGSRTAIPELTGRAPTGEPQAELWMGAHPSAPSLLDTPAGPQPLDALIAREPMTMLGPSTVHHFGPTLPFLLKVLAADRPLSVQVHPTREQAAAGFDDEEARGIPLDAPDRTYKDRGHKPELICALSDFEALCGFRPAEATATLLDTLDVPLLEPWASALRSRRATEVLPALLRSVLAENRPNHRELGALTHRLRRIAATDSPHAKACAAYARAADEHPGDPGLIPALLLNHIRLAPGQALYLGAGVPHAYLRGTGVEVMANSDNVLRCGLTPKHIDTEALLAATSFHPSEAHILTPTPEGRFQAPAEEFSLTGLHPTESPSRADLPTPQILLCTKAEASLHSPGGAALALPRGAAAYLRPGAGPVWLTGPNAEVFRATTGTTGTTTPPAQAGSGWPKSRS